MIPAKYLKVRRQRSLFDRQTLVSPNNEWFDQIFCFGVKLWNLRLFNIIII